MQGMYRIGWVALTVSLCALQAQASCGRFDGRDITQVVVPDELEIRSVNGNLAAVTHFRQAFDPTYAAYRFCFEVDEPTVGFGEGPVLRLHPGDHLRLTVVNELPPADPATRKAMPPNTACGDTFMDSTSTNVHFHGFHVPAQCHMDQVLYTIINSGTTFTFDFSIPSDHPPGLYWYHPHVHGTSNAQVRHYTVQGGSAAALVIEGLEAVYPDEIGGLVERIFTLRDIPRIDRFNCSIGKPAWDISVNHVPIRWPDYPLPSVYMKPGEKQFWRLLNAAGEASYSLSIEFDGVPQNFTVVGRDGTPLQRPIQLTTLEAPTGARWDVVVTAPLSSAVNVQLVTNAVPTMFQCHPKRSIFNVKLNTTDQGYNLVPVVVAPPEFSAVERIDLIMDSTPVATRYIHFDSFRGTFWVTIQGEENRAFSINEAPRITVRENTVEDWVISNITPDEHEFHIHQIHFVPYKHGNVTTAHDDLQLMDVIRVPPSTTPGFPDVTLRMDFRGAILGDAVYHCHILGHEDLGMMARFEIIVAETAAPTASPTTRAPTPSPSNVNIVGVFHIPFGTWTSADSAAFLAEVNHTLVNMTGIVPTLGSVITSAGAEYSNRRRLLATSTIAQVRWTNAPSSVAQSNTFLSQLRQNLFTDNCGTLCDAYQPGSAGAGVVIPIDNSSGRDNDLSAGELAGIIVGSVAGAALLGLAMVGICTLIRRSEEKALPKTTEMPSAEYLPNMPAGVAAYAVARPLAPVVLEMTSVTAPAPVAPAAPAQQPMHVAVPIYPAEEYKVYG